MAKNKLAKFAELETFAHVFQIPSQYFRDGNQFPLQGEWSRRFFNNDRPIVLELGCGKGEYTVELARRYPDKNYIGVDIKGARLWRGAKTALEDNLSNVAFIRTDIEMIDHFFAPGEVSEIWLTFPDPQMKKRNKRLTSTPFINRYLNFLNEDGVIHLKTDSNFMFTYTSELVKLNHFAIHAYIDDIYSQKEIEPILTIRTYYEQQWIERGLTIKYIQFSPKHEEALLEPEIEIEPDPYRSFKRDRRIQQTKNS